VSTAPVFSRKLLAIWIAGAAFLLALSLYLMDQGSGDAPGGTDSGRSSFSRSAIGHLGLTKLLQFAGMRVLVSRYGGFGGSDDRVLVIAEPSPTPELFDLMRHLETAPRVLLVLAKRYGNSSRDKPGWLADSFEIPIEDSALPVKLLNSDIEVRRGQRAVVWDRNDLDAFPDIDTPLQLMQSKSLAPIVATHDGILLGRLDRANQTIWILSDPDVIENHGITHGMNAAFAVAMFDLVGGKTRALLFDETEHGYSDRPPGPLKLLFTFPYVFATIQGGIALLLLLWATVGRFGKAEPMAPALPGGKLGLIRNSANLLGRAGFRGAIVKRYVLETLQDAARQLHAPAGLAPADQIAWLDRVGNARGVALVSADLVARLDALVVRAAEEATALRGIALDTYRWKRGIIDGHPADRGHHREDPRRGP
jgi:hypothetical protein